MQTQKLKQTEIGKIPEDWEVVKLENVAEILDNKRVPLSSMERNKMKGSYPYCGANGVIDYINDYIFDGEYILLAEDGGDFGKFGNSAYMMYGKFWVNNHAHILKAIENKILNSFLLYVLNFDDLNIYIVGSTRKKLNQAKLREIRICLPPLPEQQSIALVLSIIDNRIDIVERERVKESSGSRWAS